MDIVPNTARTVGGAPGLTFRVMRGSSVAHHKRDRQWNDPFSSNAFDLRVKFGCSASGAAMYMNQRDEQSAARGGGGAKLDCD